MPGFGLVGEAASGEEAIEFATKVEPDLVLMDVMMAGIGGIEAARRIAATHPDTVIVLLSSYSQEDLPLDRARLRGSGLSAQGGLRRPCPGAALARAVSPSRSAR